MNKPYKPVDCDFYDQLESFSVLKQPCDILYLDNQGHEATIHGVIQDLFTQDHVEYLKLRQGDVIRLDQIIEVDARANGGGRFHIREGRMERYPAP